MPDVKQKVETTAVTADLCEHIALQFEIGSWFLSLILDSVDDARLPCVVYPHATMTAPVTSMDVFPQELIKRLAGFLCSRDACRFSQTHKHIYKLLCLSKLRLSDPLFADQSWIKTAGPHRGMRLQLPIQNRCHTVYLRGRCAGDLNSRVYVVGTTTSTSSSSPRNRSNARCRIAAQSSGMQYSETNMTLQFNAQDDETYDLWYNIERGRISIYDLRVVMIIYDEPAEGNNRRTLAETFSSLEQGGALQGRERPFHFRMLQGVARTLLAQTKRGEMPDINMKNFFESFSIAVSEQSMLAIDQIASSFLEFRDVCSLATEGEMEDDVEVLQQLFPAATVLPFEPQRDRDNNNDENNNEAVPDADRNAALDLLDAANNPLVAMEVNEFAVDDFENVENIDNNDRGGDWDWEDGARHH